MSDVDSVVAAIRLQQPVVLPFDTVYGLAAEPYHELAAQRLYRLKGRVGTQPTAIVAASVDDLLELVPELRGRAACLARALLPGPLTLVVPNPAGRYRWVTGTNPTAIGVRVPHLTGPTRAVLDDVGAVIATSANHPGGADPHRLDDVPNAILAGAAAAIDGGDLPGTPSTVVDLTAPEPRVLREGAVSSTEVLRRLDAAVRST